MSDSLFVQEGLDTFSPTEHSRGPWDAELLHGGPVAALLARQLCASAPGETPSMPVRLTVDLVRPVPMAPLTVTTTVIRAGRLAQLISADCTTNGSLVARATLQLVTRRVVPIPPDSAAREWARTGNVETPEGAPRMWPGNGTSGTTFHGSSVEHRSRDKALSGGGAATDWIRVDSPLLPGVAMSPFERVVAAADFTNGISSSLPFEEFTYVNADLSVNIFRLPDDEWVLVDAVTHISDDGVGLAESCLSDRKGLLGHACQSLVVGKR